MAIMHTIALTLLLGILTHTLYGRGRVRAVACIKNPDATDIPLIQQLLHRHLEYAGNVVKPHG